jgi:flagellar hook-associated protein 3 FlgL
MTASFYPVGSSRSSAALSITRLLYQINTDQNAITDLQTQLSTGRRIQRLSQDPGAAIRSLAAQRQLDFKAQVDTNLDSADTLLTNTESVLSQAQAIVTDMRGVAVQAGNNTLSAVERSAANAQLQAAYTRLTELGNSKFQDQYIFAGSNVTSLPFRSVNDAMRFTGKNDELLTISDSAATVASNVTAEDTFGVRSDFVVGTVDLNPRLTPATPLTLLNRGDGIRGGAIAISNNIESVELDLSGVHNLGEVADAINAKQLSGRTLAATIGANGIEIAYQDGLPGFLNVSDVGGGNAAGDLGIATTGNLTTSPLIGKDLDPQATLLTSLSQLLGGAGIASGQSFTIKQGTRNYTISTNGANTVEDLLNVIRRSGAKVEASLDSTGRHLAIRSTESGTTLTIAENGGDLATRLGLRTFDLNTPLSRLNFGQGVFISDTVDDLLITRNDGTNLSINLDGALTVGDVISRINNNAANFNIATRVVASLATNGNGLVLSSPVGAQPLAVANVGGSQAASGLGLIPYGQTSVTGNTSGTNSVIQGADISGVQVEGVFSSIIRLKSAITNNRPEDLPSIVESIDADLERLSMARGVVGSRQQSIESIKSISADQQIALKQIESHELDSDLAKVISDLTGRQAALEASLQMMGQVTKLTLFNYI